MFVKVNIGRMRTHFLGVLKVELSFPILSSTGNFEYIKCVFTLFTYQIHSWNLISLWPCNINNDGKEESQLDATITVYW